MDENPPLGLIPYGFHVRTKNGNVLVTGFYRFVVFEFSEIRVLYGISDNRRCENSILFTDIEEWSDKGIGEGAIFK